VRYLGILPGQSALAPDNNGCRPHLERPCVFSPSVPDSTPSHPSERARLLAAAWKTLRAAAVASLVLQAAGSVELVLSGEPADRLGTALFSAGWLTLVGIVTYGVCLRARWALWLAGGYSALSIPVILLAQIVPRLFTVQFPAFTVKGITPASTVIDLLSLIASSVLVYGLVSLRRAKRA
jgi:hypothetical protein